MSLNKTLIRVTYVLSLLCAILVFVGAIFLVESKTIIFQNQSSNFTEAEVMPEPFPVSVNIHTGEIGVNPEVDNFFYTNLASAPEAKQNWWNKVAAVFAEKAWYQNLASPVGRIIVIWPGERKEEVVNNIAGVLRWTEAEKVEFMSLMDNTDPLLSEGKYFPGQYLSHRNATPADISQLVYEKFQSDILDRYTKEVASQVPFEDALIIASLLEREASDFNNMREVSGVIWNRLFIDMPLQLDATLQYIKAGQASGNKWWPLVRPQDKFLDSTYNTYKNSGLPPTPIANPSAESVLAALNPIATPCLYYFHTDEGDYYCSETYEQHVAKLKSLYGRGS